MMPASFDKLPPDDKTRCIEDMHVHGQCIVATEDGVTKYIPPVEWPESVK